MSKPEAFFFLAYLRGVCAGKQCNQIWECFKKVEEHIKKIQWLTLLRMKQALFSHALSDNNHRQPLKTRNFKEDL